MSSTETEERYPIFEQFCECMDSDGAESAKEFMSDVDFANEILALFSSKEGFDEAVTYVKSLEFARANFVPIETGGLIYIRCAVPDDETFDEIGKKLAMDSQEILGTPTEALDFTMPETEEEVVLTEDLLTAVADGDGAASARALIKLHGSLDEVLFLEGDIAQKSVLRFSNGTEISAGQGTLMAFLGFGSKAHGNNFSTFLTEAGFTLTDVSGLEAPRIIKVDGSEVEGKRVGSSVEWSDDREATPVWETK